MKVDVFLLAIGFAITGAFGSILYIALGMNIIRYNLLQLIKDSLKTIMAVVIAIVGARLITNYLNLLPFFTLFIGFTIATILYFSISIITKNLWLSSFIKLIRKK